ncbi:Transcriptional regulator, AcrR family [hydrothermal vent metagenome]|uniref:Transcriptional regulator, AcrR family n=1 Tax=hydrothermal vent metagenome TaxID=652676 RepID=A0A3B1DVD7_9ZZZZ
MRHLDDTSTRILQTAGPFFAKNGFQGTTVREICSQAKVNLSAINYHFGDKESLYIATIQLAHQSRTEKYPLPEWDEKTPTATKLRGFITTLILRMVGVGEDDRWQTELIFREVTQPTAACESLVADYFRPNMNCLLEILGEVLPAETPQHQRLQTAFSIVGQCLFYRTTAHTISMMVSPEEQQQHYRTEQLANHITTLTLASLGMSDTIQTQTSEPNESQQNVSRNLT